ncbi:hypothetical protein ACIA8O_34615 [Kitasatospora sp. NPDC051853]|uniref:hypothetical protein n=1 Tax=Kitasatospora sp. NPDC051853 TaxID=3364058 RepID=UPI0037BD3ECB
MPGSVTIGHTDALVMLSHDDAARLARTLRALSEGGPAPAAKDEEEDQAQWSRRLADYLDQHL